MTSFLDDMKKRAKTTASELGDPEENQRRRTLDTVSAQCQAIARDLETEIGKNATGKNWGHPIGRITHRLSGTSGFPISLVWPFDYNSGFKLNDVKSTPGFVALTEKCALFGVKLELTEQKNPPSINPVICISGWEP